MLPSGMVPMRGGLECFHGVRKNDSQSKRKASTESNGLLLHNLWDFGRAILTLQLTLRYIKGWTQRIEATN